MFEVGDKIVHPAHGAGVIAAIEQSNVLDEFNRYYVIELAAQDMRLMVPVRTAEEIGLRSVAGDKRSKEVLGLLKSTPEELPDDFKKRQAHLMDRLREGDAASLARVVRDMAHRSREKTYSPTEARLYDQARTMLAGELALAQGLEVDAALEQIETLTRPAEDVEPAN
jgi:CarD family transcriptional regulator